ncbi:hypothetical protein GN956_G12762 [Arapaima gigas]
MTILSLSLCRESQDSHSFTDQKHEDLVLGHDSTEPPRSPMRSSIGQYTATVSLPTSSGNRDSSVSSCDIRRQLVLTQLHTSKNCEIMNTPT